MASQTKTSVIIIGGSIGGLFNALFLSACHVPVVVIERHPASSPHPRAVGWTPRTLELLRTVGLDKAMPPLPPGHGGRPRRIKTKTLNGQWTEEIHWNKPAPKQETNDNGGPKPNPGLLPNESSLTPVYRTGIAQDKLEPLIRKKVIELGADLRLGCTMTTWTQDADGVFVTAVDPDGNEFSVRGEYLIACDGGNSRFRQDLGITTSGEGHLRTLHSILFRCPSIDHYPERGFRQWVIQHDENDPDASWMMLAYPDGRWALMSTDDAHDQLDEPGQRALICKAIGEPLPDESIQLLARGKWDLKASVATRFSSGRVFLSGDAAHALPPSRGGYGANTGVADAHNLAWKLAAVLQGRAARALLDTYDAERRPVALVRHDQMMARDDYREMAGLGGRGGLERKKVDVALLDDAAVEFGQLYRSSAVLFGDGDDGASLPDALTPAQWRGQPGTRAPHIRLLRGDGEEISSLDLFGYAWVVLFQDDAWRNIVGEWVSAKKDCELVQIGKNVQECSPDGGVFLDTFGLDSDGAVLIRPDGHIAARWTSKISAGDFEVAFKKVAHLL